jgi:hypothetical protein
MLIPLPSWVTTTHRSSTRARRALSAPYPSSERVRRSKSCRFTSGAGCWSRSRASCSGRRSST